LTPPALPLPCCPRLIPSRWNLDPYRSLAKIGGICWRTIPGPLSATVIRKRLGWLAGGAGSPVAAAPTPTTTSGRIPASSHASRALSTASLTHVSSALRGLSKPSRWRFLVKNSETEISRWRAPISTADTAGFAGLAGGSVLGESRVRPRVRMDLSIQAKSDAGTKFSLRGVVTGGSPALPAGRGRLRLGGLWRSRPPGASGPVSLSDLRPHAAPLERDHSVAPRREGDSPVVGPAGCRLLGAGGRS